MLLIRIANYGDSFVKLRATIETRSAGEKIFRILVKRVEL